MSDSASIEYLAGRYMTFRLAEEHYAISVLAVQEIIGLLPVTRLPRSQAFIRGVINLRGKVIPVVDLRAKFQLPATSDTERTCIIVVQAAGLNDEQVIVGAIVDEVSEVVDVSFDQLEPPPPFSSVVTTDFITGMGKLDDRVLILLDIDRVLGGSELMATSP